MSWIDSWARPNTTSKPPSVPIYISYPDLPYCHTCGRVMSSKKQPPPPQTLPPSAPKKPHQQHHHHHHQRQQRREVKYCSARCRARKPGAKDRLIERHIAALLDGEPDSGIETTAARSRIVKGDHRMVVTCDEIETVVFGAEEKVCRSRRRRKRAADEGREWRSVDMESSLESEDDADGDGDGGVQSASFDPDADIVPLHVSRLKSAQAPVEGDASIVAAAPAAANDDENGAAHDPTKRREDGRREGSRRAEQREMVRRAARRVIVFGVEVTNSKHDMATLSSSLSKAALRDRRGKGRNRRNRAGDDAGEDGEEDGEDRGDGGGSRLQEARERRNAEALVNGAVVEPSFAKGNWALRWRE